MQTDISHIYYLDARYEEPINKKKGKMPGIFDVTQVSFKTREHNFDV